MSAPTEETQSPLRREHIFFYTNKTLIFIENMKFKIGYDNYPYRFIILSNLLQFLIYLIGAYILYLFGIIWVFLYIIYIFLLEIRLLKKSCINCYYFGKLCAFGKGKASSIFFKKGNPKKFIEYQIRWIDIIPDFLVFIIPMVLGVYLILTKFNFIILTLVVLLFLFGSVGNGIIRGSIACKYCKQREIGCPAEKLFNKSKKE